MNEISNLMLKYWWVAPVVSVFVMLGFLADNWLCLETGKEFMDYLFVAPFLAVLLFVAKILRFATFVFAIVQKRWKIALLLVLTMVVCVIIILEWVNISMQISGW
ncbi:MAG: hypothetical protein IJL57_03300 [Bacteroidales bacterium]|nr:hypothetical protein [Bacteroidales bacterium]